MEQELHHPLRPLRERLGRVQVEEADQVDEQERREERERHRCGARHAPVEPLEPVDREHGEEQCGKDVREGERPGDLPLELRERDGEHGREEQPLDHGRWSRDDAWTVEGEGRHGAKSYARQSLC